MVARAAAFSLAKPSLIEEMLRLRVLLQPAARVLWPSIRIAEWRHYARSLIMQRFHHFSSFLQVAYVKRQVGSDMQHRHIPAIAKICVPVANSPMSGTYYHTNIRTYFWSQGRIVIAILPTTNWEE